MILTYTVTVGILGLWLGRMIQEKRKIFTPTLWFWPLMIFLVSQILSTVFSLHPHTSIFGYYSRFHGGLLSTLTYTTLFFAAVSNLQRNDVRPLIRTLLIAALGVTLYAIPEHFGISPSCIIITGQASVNCWIQDVQNRVFATFGQPNWLAAYLVMVFPLVWWYWQQILAVPAKKKVIARLDQLLVFALTITIPLTLAYTKSRSGFFAFIVVLALLLLAGSLFAFTKFRERSKTVSLFQNCKQLFAKNFFLLVITSLVLIVAGTPYSPGLEEFLTRQNQPVAEIEQTPPSGTVLETGGTDSGSIRKIVWKGAIAVWQRYPIFGSGVETFAYSYYLDRPREHNDVSEWDFLYNKAHNEFLNALATTGIVGLIALLILHGSIVFFWLDKTIEYLDQGKGGNGVFAAAGIASFAGMTISNFFGFSTVMVGILSFLIPALWFVPDKTTERKITPLNSSQWTLVGLTLGLSLVFLSQIWTWWSSDRLFATSKALLDTGESFGAYTAIVQVTEMNPREAVFWDQRAITMARLAAGTASEDATLAAQLTQDALLSSDQALTLNPHQLNFWKGRARVLILLGQLDDRYLNNAVETLEEARKLAPTDAKLAYNQALIFDVLAATESAETAFTTAITLRPNYEEVRNSYAQFLEKENRPQEAITQYRYILEHISSSAPTALERVEALKVAP